MYAKILKCVSCENEYPLEPLYECEVCGGILEVIFDYNGLDISELKDANKQFQREDYLPLKNGDYIYNGEGNTPLTKAKRLGEKLQLAKLYLKHEQCNPTGSFKDRPVSVGISKAVEFGYDEIVVASSGNGAASVASYAANVGVKAKILVPENTPKEKINQALFYGGEVIKVKGPYSNSFNLAKEMSEKQHLFNLTTTFINPYTVEGDKIVAYELYKQLKANIPDYIFVPIGAGPLLVGIYKGYKELFDLSIIDKVPKMVGIQAEGCSPIARAYIDNRVVVESEDNPQTIAGGICDGLTGYSKDGTHTLSIINKTEGHAQFVSDKEIKEAQFELAKYEGVFVEPSSAATVAGIKKSIAEKRIQKTHLIVAMLTGHGLKDMNSISC